MYFSENSRSSVFSAALTDSAPGWEKVFTPGKEMMDLSSLTLGDLPFKSKGEITPWTYIEEARHLVALQLIGQNGIHKPEGFDDELSRQTEALLNHPHWKEFQLAQAYECLACRLNDRRVEPLDYVQSEGGAANLDIKGHFRWGALPHLPFHAELGLVWSLIGVLTGDERALAAAERLAQWHMNTLDADFAPFMGLFTREEVASRDLLCGFNAFMYTILASRTKRSDFEKIAFETRAQLDRVFLSRESEFPLLIRVLDKLYARPAALASSFKLSREIYDPSLALIGVRGEKEQVVLSLGGGGTGMGTLVHGDVELTAFGPQHDPISECQGFGIMGFSHNRGKEKKFVQIEQAPDKIQLQGICRLVPEGKLSTSLASYMNGIPSDIWLDVQQIYQDHKLHIAADFIGLKPGTQVFFTFFAKAKTCQVEGEPAMSTPSLSHFQDLARPVFLRGERSQLTLFSSFAGEMEVIPLSGKGSFWGADFMIAYKLSPQNSRYSWIVESLDSY